MNMYEKNLSFFKGGAPALYQVLTTQESQYPSNVTLLESLNMEIQNDETTCFAHSFYDTAREVQEMFSPVRKDVEVLFLFGMGLWIAEDYIVETYKNLKTVILIEPDLNVFKTILHHVDFSSLIKRLPNLSVVINQTKEETFFTVWDLFSADTTLKTDFAYSLPYRSLYPGYYEHIHHEFFKTIRDHMTNIITQDNFMYLWAKNILENYKHDTIFLTEFINKFENIPTVIVSAGPSLNHNIHYLKEMQNKAVIMAVGSAIKILDSNDITPHFRLAFDPMEGEGKIFEQIDTEVIPLIFSDYLFPEILDNYKGPKLRMLLNTDHLSRYIFRNFYNETFIFESGFSIANVALDIAIKLGSKKIIFMGQDLCYTEGSLYAKGSWKDDDGNIDFENGRFIKAINTLGETVYTNRVFLGMKNAIENKIKQHSEMTYLNATERGLNIEGAANRNIEQIIKEHLTSTYSIDTIIYETISQLEGNHHTKTTIYEQLFKLDLPVVIGGILEINLLRQKMLDKVKKYLQKGIGVNKLQAELRYIEDNISQQLEGIEFYSQVIRPAIQVKIYALKQKYNYNGENPGIGIANKIEALSGETQVLKSYLDFFLRILEEISFNENLTG